MNEFVLVILVTMALGKEPSYFEIRLPKETYKKCLEDSKTYEFPFKEITLGTFIEKPGDLTISSYSDTIFTLSRKTAFIVSCHDHNDSGK